MANEAEPVSDRRTMVVSAARDVFLRYGYGRTTMGDIAQAAGLTRPTLYLSFRDKESIFHAVIRAMVADRIAEIRLGVAARKTLEEQLVFACETWVLGAYELVRDYPDAQDLFDLKVLPVRESHQAFEALIADIIRQPLADSRLDIPEHLFAAVISNAVKGFKDMAQDNAALCDQVKALAAVTAAGLRAPNRF